jgi:AmmeMemoRadiSam system protein B
MARIREPAVAGRFYPADPIALRADITSYVSAAQAVDANTPRVRAVGCIAPHAGYIYSGLVAATVFSRIEIPSGCVVLCPNHTGHGHRLAIMKDGEWRTPLGNVKIDTQIAEALMNAFPALADDSVAHQSEHAIEVELPFLQVRRPEAKIVPIAIGTGNLMILEQLGEAIANVVRASSQQILIIASSDMNHYEDDATTRIKDHKAIERILALDARGLHQTTMSESISMCGFGPAVTMLTAARTLGAQHAELVQYATSGDVSGDMEMVVGYAGIVVS